MTTTKGAPLGALLSCTAVSAAAYVDDVVAAGCGGGAVVDV